ncbi:uncharacterized protein BO95DRAFT_189486 [Aspergillus brunneoviolaceus CBS 621.78]|uniref:Uncharacterized protein n=1 Tax=Aspergillus brunneoviolaceus CBS 621.78 TaxID=1450534 RepID=A0ACD1G4B8_9EURO|nr:hypothetical protein BO95DRAFT_189486 [Aspergillus brunneoviolaceus CBS 621.78]RAH44013.1 hypothetical protein BO95DRAFT_189486 [Aspergillus brunneoviolaceus CBS 621.78]
MARIKQGIFSWEDVLAQRYQNNKPTALPRTRRSSSAQQGQRASQPQPQQQPKPDTRGEWTFQRDSSLLAKLSPELRMTIWELVQGGMRIHIVQRANRRMGHVVCPETSGGGRRDGVVRGCEICQGGLPSATKAASRRPTTPGLLALALTCKQIYTESIYTLYTLNTFEFSNTWSLTYLRPTIPADFWDAIRAVELRWAFPGHWLPSKDPVKTVYFAAGRQQWVETCQAVTRMRSLQTFTLQLPCSWFGEPVEKLPLFLEPLRGLHLPRRRWTLQLPRQPYYVQEVGNIDGELRERGIECCVWAVGEGTGGGR